MQTSLFWPKFCGLSKSNPVSIFSLESDQPLWPKSLASGTGVLLVLQCNCPVYFGCFVILHVSITMSGFSQNAGLYYNVYF